MYLELQPCPDGHRATQGVAAAQAPAQHGRCSLAGSINRDRFVAPAASSVVLQGEKTHTMSALQCYAGNGLTVSLRQGYQQVQRVRSGRTCWDSW